jgi:small subunit ribosomal protein S9
LLCKIEQQNRFILKQKKLLRRDSRVKERKKYGLRKARKAPQYSKR